MFKTLQATWPKDDDYPERTFRLSILQRVLNGTLYENLPHAFHDEKNAAEEYIPLRQRRPSVRYNLCRLVVDDSVALLFSEGHFPELDCGKDGEKVREALQRVIKESALNSVMIDAATRGSVGSIAIMFRVLEARVFFEVMETANLEPTWKASAPDTLEKVTEQYKVTGKALKESGYPVTDADLKVEFWFRREWTETQEAYYLPWKVSEDDAKPARDDERTITHSLGFVPVVWVRNLPGGDAIDGACTFPSEAIDTGIEIDYLLSQGGRGLKYASDPTLLIKEPAVGSQGEMVKGAGNALVVSADGDAKLLEINGTATEAVINYARFLREIALESLHGNRANADKLSAAQSGRAMELMNQALIWLADKLRISYGEGALLSLLNMIMKASEKIPLAFKDGTKAGKLELVGQQLALRWPAWYQPTAQDRENVANTLRTHTDAGHMSRETAVKTIAADYDIEDVAGEITKIEKEEAARNADAQKQVKIQE